MAKDLILVGSVPYDTAQEVFETFGAITWRPSPTARSGPGNTGSARSIFRSWPPIRNSRF